MSVSCTPGGIPVTGTLPTGPVAPTCCYTRLMVIEREETTWKRLLLCCVCLKPLPLPRDRRVVPNNTLTSACVGETEDPASPAVGKQMLSRAIRAQRQSRVALVGEL